MSYKYIYMQLLFKIGGYYY